MYVPFYLQRLVPPVNRRVKPTYPGLNVKLYYAQEQRLIYWGPTRRTEM